MSSLPCERRDDPRRGRRQTEPARQVRGLKIREDGDSVEIEPAGKLLNFTKAASANAVRGLFRFSESHRSGSRGRAPHAGLGPFLDLGPMIPYRLGKFSEWRSVAGQPRLVQKGWTDAEPPRGLCDVDELRIVGHNRLSKRATGVIPERLGTITTSSAKGTRGRAEN
jgi:hypothetical protein